MKRFHKIILAGLLVVISLVAGGMLLLDRWLNSDAFHAEMENRLEKALQIPIRIEEMDASLFRGITMKGVRVSGQTEDFLGVDDITVSLHLRSLLLGRMVLDEIKVENPRFLVVRDENGKWRLPEFRAKAKDPSSPKSVSKQQADKQEKSKDRGMEIRKIIIKNGRAEIADHTGRQTGTLQGIQLKLSNVTLEMAEGSMAIESIDFPEWGKVEKFSGGVSLTKKKGLIVPKFAMKAGGGEITGHFAVEPKDGRPWNFKVQIESVNSSEAVAPDLLAKFNLTGIVDGELTMSGNMVDGKKLEGNGNLAVRNGSFRELELARDIGVFLGFQDMADLKIEKASSRFQVGNERIFVDDLVIDCAPFRIEAKGTSRWDDKLKLDARLLVEERILEGRSLIEGQFSPPDANKHRAVEFKVQGKWSKPKHNLLEQITGTKDRRKQRLILGGEILLGSGIWGKDAEGESGEPTDLVIERQ